MGVVVPFADFERAKVAASAQQLAAGDYGDRATVEALRAAVDQAGVLAAARPLLAVCRDRYGFVVMHDGLPNAPAILSRALLELSYGLAMLDAEMKAPRTYPTYGVYFGRRQLGWLEDRYSGATGLAVPNEFKSADLAAFVRPRIVRPRSRSQD